MPSHSSPLTSPVFPTLVIPERDADLPSSPLPFPSPTQAERSPSPTALAFPPSPRASLSPSRSPTTSMARSHSPSSTPPVRPTFMRVRQTSLPASLVQSRHYSLVGSSGLSASAFGGAGGGNRVSVASFGSFDSLPEEGEGDDGGGGEVPSSAASVQGRPPLERRSMSPPASRRTSIASRTSLPPSGASSYQAFSVVRQRTTSASTRAASPMPQTERSEEERAKRAERRWRIAEELRETEKAYVRVLEEVDALYYQPLIEALPLDDPLSRRSSKRYSALGQHDSPHSSPRHSMAGAMPRMRTSTADSLVSAAPSPSSNTTPPNGPILSRREINEIFSNFTDVLNLAHVMLLTLDEAVPLRPSQPVSISPSSSASAVADVQVSHSAPMATVDGLASSLEDVGLSRSGGTVESDGPETPAEGDSPPPARATRKAAPRQRTLSTRSMRRAGLAPPPAPPLRLGSALLPILPFLKQYSLFAANFSASLSLLSRLDGSSSSGSSASAAQWQAFVAAQQQLGGMQAGKIGLAGLLLNIVQRVPRYRMLLKDLLRYTEEDHPDARDLQAAFNLVDTVASHLDSQISAHTNALAILDLQRSFLPGSFPSSPLLAPGRTLLTSGSLSQVSHAGGSKPRTFFLFSDLIVVAAAEDAWLGDEARYRPVGRFGLEDVTVVGRDDVDEDGKRRGGFEVLSSERSFAVYAETVDERDAWLEAIRDAKAALTSARATLQRVGSVAQLAPIPAATSAAAKLGRRISLPVPASSPAPSPLGRSRSAASHLAIPLARQVSVPPALGYIPPTPADGIDRFIFPSSPGAVEIVQSPLESPAFFARDAEEAGPPPFASSNACDASPTVTAASGRPSTPPAPIATAPLRPSLARSRRWSDLPTSSAFAAISSVFTTPSPDLTSSETAYPVIDAYQAPVWVPDSRAPRCQRCAKMFGVWRRKHHCRLCGAVVCWECSTKYFVIPSSLLSSSSTSSSTNASTTAQPDRLARACDTCFTSVFAPTTPASRFLTSHPAADVPSSLGAGVGAGRGSVKWTGTWRLSKALGPAGGLEPLWDLEELTAGEGAAAAERDDKENAPAPPPAPGGPRRTRKRSAVNQLKALLRD